MKNVRRFAVFLLAMVMVFAMTAPAFATEGGGASESEDQGLTSGYSLAEGEGGSITIANPVPGVTYQLYLYATRGTTPETRTHYQFGDNMKDVYVWLSYSAQYAPLLEGNDEVMEIQDENMSAYLDLVSQDLTNGGHFIHMMTGRGPDAEYEATNDDPIVFEDVVDGIYLVLTYPGYYFGYAFLVDGNDYTIIDTSNLEVGSVTVHDPKAAREYPIYEMIDMYSYDNATGQGYYQINYYWTEFFARDEVKAYVTVSNDRLTWHKDYDEAFTLMALDYAETHSGINPIATKTAGSGSLTFTELPLGVHLVDTILGDVVSLDINDHDAEVWEISTGEPSLTKQITSDPEAANDGVDYITRLVVQPGGVNYVVHDVMSSNLTLDSSSIRVYGCTANDYTITYNKTHNGQTCAFEIAFTSSFLNGLTQPRQIAITYSATPDTLRSGTAVNTAWLTYDTNSQTAPASASVDIEGDGDDIIIPNPGDQVTYSLYEIALQYNDGGNDLKYQFNSSYGSIWADLFNSSSADSYSVQDDMLTIHDLPSFVRDAEAIAEPFCSTYIHFLGADEIITATSGERVVFQSRPAGVYLVHSSDGFVYIFVTGRGKPVIIIDPNTVDGSITVQQPVAGRAYNIYRPVDLIGIDSETNLDYYRVADAWEDFFNGNNVKDVYVTFDEYGYLSLKAGITAAELTTLKGLMQAYITDNRIAHDGTLSGSGTSILFDTLPLGYYLVETTTGALCSLDVQNPHATVTESFVPRSFDIVKTDSSNNLLSGAEFELTADGGATAVNFVLENGAYRVATAGETGATTTITMDSGIVRVTGLNAAVYSLKETKAPAGHIKTEAEYTVDLTSGDRTTTLTAGATQWTENDGGVHVVNVPGAELPVTGGMGTTMLYVLGTALVLGAAVLLVSKKRMTVA